MEERKSLIRAIERRGCLNDINPSVFNYASFTNITTEELNFTDPGGIQVTDYAGKNVVIIGCASGLGRGIAERMAKGGAKLALADRHAATLFEFADSLRAQEVEVETTVLDVRDPDAIEAFADKTFESFGEVDYFINSAGMSSMGSIFRLPLSEWQMVFDMNVMNLVYGIRAFGPRMIEQNDESRIINVASNAGLEINAFLPAYFASKAAAVSLSESLAVELQAIGSKVKTHVFCPGLVKTPLSYNSSELRGNDEPYFSSEEFAKLTAAGKNALASGMELAEAIDGFFAGLEADDFYIRTHANEEDQVIYRTEVVRNRTRPLPIPMR